MKSKIFCTSKEITKKVKRQPSKRRRPPRGRFSDRTELTLTRLGARPFPGCLRRGRVLLGSSRGYGRGPLGSRPAQGALVLPLKPDLLLLRGAQAGQAPWQWCRDMDGESTLRVVPVTSDCQGFAGAQTLALGFARKYESPRRKVRCGWPPRAVRKGPLRAFPLCVCPRVCPVSFNRKA